MSLNNDGIMVILSSPSGAGKTTLVKLLSKSRDFYTSISHTTRKPRNNEEEGKDYYFVNNDQFQNLIKKNEFLEYANVFSHLYGTTKTPVIKNLEKSGFSNGTRMISNNLAKIAESDVAVIAGGGDTSSALKYFNLIEKLTHVSTGGGASLELLSGKNLKAIEKLEV